MNSHDYFNLGSYTTIEPNGTTIVTSSNMSRKLMVVTNGNVQGDFKSANPIYFYIDRITYGHGNVSQGTVLNSQFRPRVIWGYGIDGYTAPHNSDTDPSVKLPELRDRNLEKIYERIRGQSNIIVDVAEGAQTLRMLKSVLSLKGLIREFEKNVLAGFSKRGRIHRGGNNLVDYVNQKWLEYRYGWSPLVYSIYDAMDTIGLQQVINGVFTIRQGSRRVLQSSIKGGSGTYASPSYMSSSWTSVRHQYVLDFRLPSGLRIRDWTSLSPVSIAWELLPFSFVGDWLVNVSQQLSLWENYWLFKNQYIGGYETVTYSRKTTLSYSGSTNYGYAYWPNGDLIDGFQRGLWTWNTSSERKSVEKNRSILANLPMPNGFRVKVNLTPKRLMDSIALISQMTGKYK
jgi:hypothetical protein